MSYILLVHTKKKGATKMGIPKGTKLTNTPKANRIAFRFDDETAKKLEYLAEAKNCTKAEIIRIGIEKQYEELQGK